MANIPTEIIQQIKQAVDIVEIIGRFVELKKKGKNYVGFSPFNAEKTPSFNVIPEKQIFKDFSSGNAGDVIKFLMLYPGTKCNFFEAASYLAKEAGIELPKEQVKKPSDPLVFKERLITINKWALEFFQSHLHIDNEDGSSGSDYLGLRGINSEMIKQFQLGYAVNAWKKLYEEAHKQGFTNTELQYAGLLNFSTAKKAYYDTFRGRVMFPIHDTMGTVISFGGRVINNADSDRKSEGKYLNGRNNTLYKKSKNLYGFNFAKLPIRISQEAILVEGYLDVITLHQAKVKNTVGSLGTALTKWHAEQIKRFCGSVNIIYDSDLPGVSAMEKGTDMLLAEGLDVYITILPEGEDPQSFLANIAYPPHIEELHKDPSFEMTPELTDEFETYKGEIFKAYVKEHKILFMDFMINAYYTKAPTPVAKTEGLNKLIKTLSFVNDTKLRTQYCNELAEKTRQFFDVISNEVEGKRKEREASIYKVMEYKKKLSQVGLGERDLMRILLAFSDTRVGEMTLSEKIVSDLSAFGYEFVDFQIDNLYSVVEALVNNKQSLALSEISNLNKLAGKLAMELLWKPFKVDDFRRSFVSPGYHPDMCTLLNNYKKILITNKIAELNSLPSPTPIEVDKLRNLTRKLDEYAAR